MALEVTDTTPLSELTVDEARRELAEIELCARVANALDKQYPGHLWAVSATGGCLTVKNLALEGQWGFILHCHRLVNEDIEKRARLAGGELLERFRISRGRGGAAQAAQFLQDRMKSPVLTLPSWAR